MIEVPTVLVLGAGTSAPFGFPTGQRLMYEITDTTFQSRQRPFMENLGYSPDFFNEFTQALRHSGRTSVDAFLEHRQKYVDIGKAAIAIKLFPYEVTANLFHRPANNIKDNWYDLLFGAIADGVSFEKVCENKLSIITFNYDRSLEHYLFTALQNSYGAGDKECAGQIAKIPIIHVHGSLGRLTWQKSEAEDKVVPYDAGATINTVELALDSIKIIHEAKIDTPEFQLARDLIEKSKRVLFLGFGFHPTNLRRLTPKTGTDGHEALGTSLGLSVDRQKDARRWNGSLGQVESLIPKKTYDFLHDHVGLSGF